MFKSKNWCYFCTCGHRYTAQFLQLVRLLYFNLINQLEKMVLFILCRVFSFLFFSVRIWPFHTLFCLKVHELLFQITPWFIG